jgi:hypothetical protein
MPWCAGLNEGLLPHLLLWLLLHVLLLHVLLLLLLLQGNHLAPHQCCLSSSTSIHCLLVSEHIPSRYLQMGSAEC